MHNIIKIYREGFACEHIQRVSREQKSGSAETEYDEGDQKSPQAQGIKGRREGSQIYNLLFGYFDKFFPI